MFAWGSTVHGELGIGGIEEEYILAPRLLDWHLADSIVDIACGESHTLFLTDQGKVYSCGNNDYGQLGHDLTRKRPQHVSTLDPYEIKQIACGSSHSMALNRWGQIFTWGSNAVGQLGYELTERMQPVPKIIKSMLASHFVQIACGSKHSVALTNSGDIYCWGCNTHGQLGIGGSSSSSSFHSSSSSHSLTHSSPSLVTSLSGIPTALVSCGSHHTLVVSKSGAVFAWGRNTYGQLGVGCEGPPTVWFPSQVRSLRNSRVRAVACGEEYTVFLTLDGGVFTCGAGMFGQLGHGGGAAGQETLPRKVLELMGSTVTQIQCGRHHTLAYVPSRGRVYSFGLGGAGQLGLRKACNATTPQVVLGPWALPEGTSGVSLVVKDKEGQSSNAMEVGGGGGGGNSYRVLRIFAGGDHCFAKVAVTRIGDRCDSSSSITAPYDQRLLPTDTQLLTISYEYLSQWCGHLTAGDTLDQELITYVETVFRHRACVNGSFLLTDEAHYCCTSRHHGVDLELAERTFALIGRSENGTVKDLIWTAITEDLLNHMKTTACDVEVLRVFLILPFYHEFSNAKQYQRLHHPFASTLLNLTEQSKRVVSSWWNSLPAEYFERLVQVFKSATLFILQNKQTFRNEEYRMQNYLVSMLDTLAFLNRLNHCVDGLKIPYDTFHITDVEEYMNINEDYINWLKSNSNANKFHLCNYPFVFDAQAKTQLLRTDQSLQMHFAMNTAQTQAVLTMLQGGNLSLLNEPQFLMLNVSRDNLVSDTIRELSMVRQSDLKKPLKVKFLNEEAEDGGGVQKEFFLLLLREILDPKYGMFQEDEDTRAIWFSESSFEDEVMYFLIGTICGLAIYNYRIINIPFPLALYKKLLNEPVTLADLKGLSPTIANSLQSILDCTELDLQEVFGINFDISRDVFGEVKSVMLVPDGANVPVTQENKVEYVNLYVDYIFNKSVQAHYDAFSMGFMKVCGGRVLELFHSHELMAVVVGNENYDWHALEESATYKDGYRSSDPVIRWFWEVVHEDMTLESKKRFLLFLTGSDRIPIQGMKAIKIVIQPTHDDKYLPVAHTCFNLLDLPRYKTKERLKYKLLQAIQQPQGFSLI